MNQEEIQTQIEEIRTELNKGDYDSYGQKKKVQEMLDSIYEPADALKDVRLYTLGESMYALTALASKGGLKRRTLPMLRASEEGLFNFLKVMERLGILQDFIIADSVISDFTSRQKQTIIDIIQDTTKTEGETKKNILLKVVSAYIFNATMERWESHPSPFTVSSSMISFIQEHTRGDGTIDYRAMGEVFHDSATGPEHTRTLLDMSVTIAMLYWSTEPDHDRTSQKARGIQVIGDTHHSLWESEPALFISLEDATESLAGEIMQSLRMAFGSINDIFVRGLFIRTCPDDPRPGALENIKAHTPTELLDGVRLLGRGMLDPELPDYDPKGCLCVMPFINPECSAVMVVGHDEIVVGPTHDAVTAGGGSNITIPLHYDLKMVVRQMVGDMELDDGMKHHELEFVWRKHRPNLFEHIFKQQKVYHTSKPVITQVRGLHTSKAPTSPPPVVEGEPLHIKGNIPTGVIIQQNLIDVEQGDLSDCMELDQMVKDGTVPDDLVIYASSGSTNCHAAGVALKSRLAIIYGQLPQEDGTQWTEIDGWVTSQEDVEPSPYDPTLFKDYYFQGCVDGDRYWQYGSVVLSQFFHTFIQKPRNDPRFEAYLAGVYSTWILKATLAVAMGEGRHAYLGQKVRYSPIHALIHIFLTSSFSGNESHFKWGNRQAYYHVFQNTEIGLENIHHAFKAYQRLFVECKWGGGSYGGKNYSESVEKGTVAAKAMLDFIQGDGSLVDVLDAVNILENAVHNCSFFFNKFIHDKQYFNIGTSHHKNFEFIERQFHIAAAFHYRFYRKIVKEPHVVWNGYSRIHRTSLLGYKSVETLDTPMGEIMTDIANTSSHQNLAQLIYDYPVLETYLKAFMREMNSAYCEDCDSHECGCVEGNDIEFHHHGTCGLEICNVSSCINYSLANKYDLTPADLAPLIDIFKHPYSAITSKPYTIEKEEIYGETTRFASDADYIFAQDVAAIGSYCHDAESSVFTTDKREHIGPSTDYKIYKDHEMFKSIDGDWKAPLVFETPSFKVIHLAEMQKQLWERWCDYFDERLSLREVILELAHDKMGRTQQTSQDDTMVYMLQDMKICVPNEPYLTYQHQRTDSTEDWRGWDTTNLYRFYLRMYIKQRWQDPTVSIFSQTSHPFALGLQSADIFQILLTKFDLDFVKEVLQI